MDDLSGVFTSKSQAAQGNQDVADMQEFMRTSATTPPPAKGLAGVIGDMATNNMAPVNIGKNMPATKPLRRETDDAMGRPKPTGESVAGTVARNVAEVPGAALRGVHDAVMNATAFLNPLTDWLDENVANLKYNLDDTIMHDPKTGTGTFVKDTAQFLTGFIPAAKALKLAGAGAASASVMAGAISEFATKDGNEARLSDWWKKSGLPQNMLTDYLSKKGDDSEFEGRLKAGIEGLMLGGLTEGVFTGIRMIKAARAVPGAVKDEASFLKGKYGEVTEDHIVATGLGDTRKPVIEIGTPPVIDAANAPKLDPRALIRGTPRKAVEEPLAGHKTTDLGDVLVNESSKEPGKFQVTFFDGPAEKGAVPTQDHVYNTRAEAIKAFEDAGPGEIKTQSWGKETPSAIRSEDFDVYVNFARFDEPDSIKFAIGKMAEAGRGAIDEATRGHITQVETEKLASDLGMSVSDLLSRRAGQTFNAEEAVAARRLWAASGEKLVQLAKAAAGADAGPLEQFAFRKMMATHSAIQAEVIGARTETARALASWAIPVKGGNIERARLVDQILQSTGGQEASQELARRLAMLAEAGADAGTIGRFAFKGYAAATADAIKQTWVNGLLANPKTHVVNVTSNIIVAFQQIYERQAAGVLNSITGGGADGVQMGEALAMAHGLIGGIGDSFRLAAQYLKTGETSFNFNKVDLAHPEAISSAAFDISRGSSMGRFVDFLGKVIGSPMHALGAEDEFFKSIGYRMEVRAQALRTANQEGHRGLELAQRVRELTDNPSEAIRLNAADAALYSTFTNEMGWFGKAVLALRNGGGPMNPTMFVMPFVRTPVNIARYAFERTPFAPLVGQWRADIAAGGARADLAMAKLSTGTMIMAAAMDMADRGILSGNGPQAGGGAAKDALVREGWKPYAMQVNGRWHSYDRLDPVGMTMGFAASIAEAVKKGEIDENDVDEWQEVVAMSIAAVSQVAVNKTYLQGISKAIQVATDPGRYSEKYVDDMFASFLPFGSLSNTVKNMADPVQREYGNPWQAVQAKIIGLSKGLPPRRDLWGAEMSGESGLGVVYDALSPVASKPIIDSPIDKEIVRLEDGPRKIAKKSMFDGVSVNMKGHPQVYDEYTRLAGNDLKHPAWGMGAKDYLNSVVSGAHPMSSVYNIMSDESKVAFINNAVQQYRQLAQQQILADPKFSGFANEVSYLKNHKFEAKMPILGE